ncbi:Amidohydrolase [Actinoalloteichus hoggarensis]|uniref:Amidohydrolase n=2 Tax=Actinoalloteichus hoggarensis TaxID=1470176 RepID=A0A221W5U4_9PSEU|nr:Amidohydrolase [Actinoalloteichus hoggarensis]
MSGEAQADGPRLFDCDLLLGRHPGSATESDAASLAARLAGLGATGGLVCSLRAAILGLRAGNDEALAAAREQPGLIAAGVLDLRDPYASLAEIERLAVLGVRAFRLLPDAQHVPSTAPGLRRIARELAERGLVALVEGDLRVGWQPFVGRDAQVVFLDAHAYHLGDLRLLCADEPGFHACVRQLVGPDSLERLAATVGADRLLFGTATPTFDAEPVALRLRRSGLSQAEAELVGAGNAARLFGTADHPGRGAAARGADPRSTGAAGAGVAEVSTTADPARPRVPPWTDGARGGMPATPARPPAPVYSVSDPAEISPAASPSGARASAGTAVVGAVSAGLAAVRTAAATRTAESAVDVARVVDVHGHVGPQPFDCAVGDLAVTGAVLDRHGIDCQLVSHTEAIFYDAVAGNRTLAALLPREPRLRGMVVVDPRRLPEARRDLRELIGTGFVGAKIHPPLAHVPIAAPEMRAALELVAEHDVPVLVHTWGEDLLDLAEVVAMVPGLRAIAGHMGGPAWRLVPAAAARCDRLWFEPSLSRAPGGRLRWVRDRIGVDRLLFGTDATLTDPASALGAVEAAGLPADELTAVLGGNARRLFRL